MLLGVVRRAGGFKFSASKVAIRMPVEVCENFARDFLVGGVIGCVWLAANVSPCESACCAKEALLGFGFQAHHQSVSVCELALAHAVFGQPSYTLVGVGSAGVAPDPWLLGVASNPDCVPSCVVLRYNVVVMSQVVRPFCVRVDASRRGVSRKGDFK